MVIFGKNVLVGIIRFMIPRLMDLLSPLRARARALRAREETTIKYRRFLSWVERPVTERMVVQVRVPGFGRYPKNYLPNFLCQDHAKVSGTDTHR